LLAFTNSNLYRYTTASLVGQGIFRTYKVADTSLKPQPSALGKREPQNYTCHSWLPEEGKERCVVASDIGGAAGAR
jgi:hypothetical protein